MAQKIMYVVILIILVAGSGARPGKTVIVDDRVSMMSSTISRKYETGFRRGGQMFNFFPKGIPIPPSAPSKRHNSFVDSTRN
ncbi:Protein IDA [Hibiscus syriacus]|uniref:Protein IDA n=1 Tax=Hibiscus syriacus TaxID=106335 RepID=A0A6A2Y2B1_HIBSY|nr:Protein IDA [Hibiscus syriacus]